ncbi:Type I restriction-modification system specificity subunit [Cupriavidus necator]|uniref:Restriction endonuclease subunit S n=1 Tax=Cupriavidus necator (strain ATCC 17699 / DSM 428 / KCTC 22496 / NCIMB 10442 / H16 / Stanier 337) TaxID=381666 RepID=Q0KFR4_CUPNH|nr:restriction endonuclease subunit S [Cupriavidus necator]QCB99132.1 restriction endonuclease subunit S [Cupriavidus necator H16]QQB78052.1 restriction endonuclease subunit S [Cupriavidus necator]WKA40953.1 restriction endonuclease subunit S [Cupriavidus necator]CAJ91157.1 Type I restriction-modification system specificity subunit [Cupriavidus necator H16]
MSNFVALGDHITVQKGKAPLVTGYVGKGAEPYLSPEYLRGRAPADLAKAGPDAVRAAEGETILLWDGSNAGEFFRSKVGLVASTMTKISPSSVFRPAYFFHVAKQAERFLKAQTNGTGIPHVDRELLEGIKVFCPGSTEQQLLAEILDTLDTAIYETEAIIAKLKAVKQGLLHDLLTRGIDANGELRPPQAEAPHLYESSPLGWIPNEWGLAPTATRCHLITKGTTPAANEMWQGGAGIRFLRVDNLSFDGQLDLDASTFRVSLATHKGFLARSRCLEGDVLTNIVGPPLGKLGLVTKEIGEVNINQAIALFRPTEQLLPKFLLIWLSSSISQSWLRNRAKQTSGQVNLTLALCQELPLPRMTINEQQAIVDRVDAAQEQIWCEEELIRKMRLEKSGLMDDLLTGRVRVKPQLAETKQAGSA